MSVQISGIFDHEVRFYRDENTLLNRKISEFNEKMSGKKQSFTHWAENRRADAHQAAMNSLLGKKGEFLARKFMTKNYGFPIIKIDMDIRHGSEKGWVPDLPYREFDLNLPNVHVKTCNKYTFGYCGDYSWTFQHSDTNGKSGRDEMFDSENDDLVALVYVDYWDSESGKVKAVVPWHRIRKFLKDPISKKYVKLKKCLYYKDFLENREEIERWNCLDVPFKMSGTP